MRFSHSAAVAACLSLSLVAQDESSLNPTAASQDVLKFFQVDAATVQQLTIPTNRISSRFQVVLGGDVYTIDMEPNDVRSPDFELLVDDGVTVRRLPTPESVTWRGTVVGVPDSNFAGSIVDGRLEGVVSLEREAALWNIQSARAFDSTRPLDEHVVFSAAASTVDNVSCGADHGDTHNHKHAAGSGISASVLQVAEIAIDADFDYYQRNGSNTTTTQNAVTTVMNGVNVIYNRDCDIDHMITTILVRTSTTYTTSDMQQLLPQFRSRWNNNQGGTQRDVAHLFTGKGSFSGIIGIAYLSVICNLQNAYGVSKAFSNSLATNVGLVAHELGHNWSSPHCNSSSPCNIMCASLGGCNNNLSSFGPASINSITSHRNSRNCLSQGGTPGQFTTFGAGCQGTGQQPQFCSSVNQNGGNLSGTTGRNEYAYEAPNSGSLTVSAFELYSRSTTGSAVTVNAAIYADTGSGPATNPLATTTITIGASAGFYRATFNTPQSITGNVYVAVDHSASTTVLSTLSGGAQGTAFWRRPPQGGGNWNTSGIIDRPSVRILCPGGGSGNATPSIGNTDLPETGQSYRVNVSLAAANAPAFLAVGLSDQVWAGGSLPFTLPATNNCQLFASTEDILNTNTSGAGNGSIQLAVPNNSSLVGVDLFHQWIVADQGANTLGYVVSNAGKATIGG